MSRKNKSQHARRRENDRKWFKQHPEQVPTTCQDCGRSDVKLQFYHERYDIPRVGRFLCEECHMKVHGTKPNPEKRAAKAARKNKYAQFSKQNPGEQQLPPIPQV
jgi:hypothetical protein